MTLRNFKRFGRAEVELGSAVVLIGPNNSGKTSALQALALWNLGVRRWLERWGDRPPGQRPGVTINRQDLFSIPIPDANHLWRALHVRDVSQIDGKQQTQNVRIEISVEAVDSAPWTCGMEFDYANPESFYCRPLRLDDSPNPPRMPVPREAGQVQVAYLPPMSGLASTETILTKGAINVALGQGRTAEVLRNLCNLVPADRWTTIESRLNDMFGVQISKPRLLPERGEIVMEYRDGTSTLDISAAGRGLQQCLLLLAHMEVNQNSVLLLDEPDAHLEILRQRDTYQLLTSVANDTRSQIVAASHSEVVLNEAAGRDIVVAFVGRPHRINDRGHQVLKALRSIGFEDYVLSEQTGWVLYLEGSTDLAILRALAYKLGHRAYKHLDRVFVHYVVNQPMAARDHFYGVREANSNLIGYALFDRLNLPQDASPALSEYSWHRREIENYIVSKESLLRLAEEEGRATGDLFAAVWRGEMEQSIAEVERALAVLGRDPWSPDTKVSDDFLPPLFDNFYRRLGVPVLSAKADYYRLAEFVLPDEVDPEVLGVLDAIADVADAAKPV